MTTSGIDFASSDTASSGAYLVTAIDLVSIDAAASHAGWAVHRIDLGHSTDMAGAVERIATALDLPESRRTGRDALVHGLSDLGWMPASGHVILIANADSLHRGAARDFTRLLDTFEDAARGWAERGTPFWTFVALDDTAFEDESG